MRHFELMRTLEVDLPTPDFGDVTPSRLEILMSSDEPRQFHQTIRLTRPFLSNIRA